MKDNNFILLDEDAAGKGAEATGGNDSKQANPNDNSEDSASKSDGIKFEEKIKLNLFSIFCSLLKGGLEIASWKVYLLLGIEFVQLLQFSFHASVNSFQFKNFSLSMNGKTTEQSSMCTYSLRPSV